MAIWSLLLFTVSCQVHPFKTLHFVKLEVSSSEKEILLQMIGIKKDNL